MQLTATQALQRGVAAHKAGRLDEADRLYRAVVSSTPKHPPSSHDINVIALAYNNLGFIQQNAGDLDAAIDSYQQAIRLKPDFAEAFYSMGSAFQVKGNLKASIECYQQLVRIQPNNADAFNVLGAVLQLKGDLEGAVDSYKQAVKVSPGFAEAYNNMGSALLAKGDLDAAIDNCKHALRIEPNYANAYNNLGHALYDKGELQAAIDSYKNALMRQPDSTQAYNNLGNAYRSLGDFAQALKYFDRLNEPEFSKVFEANPTEHDFWLNTKSQSLECLYTLGRYSELEARIKELGVSGDINRRVAAVSAFVTHQLKLDNPHTFCKNPLDFVHVGSLADYVPDVDSFIAELIREGRQENQVWEPKHGVTKFGFQTANTIFNAGKGCESLEKFLRQEIANYYSRFKAADCAFINKWPAEYDLKGWFARLVKNGHQRSHIHPAGWLSGIVYLKTIDTADSDEGSIEMGLHGFDLPILDNSFPRKNHQPKPGEILLFPSSLFHRTIPYNKDAERCVIAFDLHCS